MNLTKTIFEVILNDEHLYLKNYIDDLGPLYSSARPIIHMYDYLYDDVSVIELFKCFYLKYMPDSKILNKILIGNSISLRSEWVQPRTSSESKNNYDCHIVSQAVNYMVENIVYAGDLKNLQKINKITYTIRSNGPVILQYAAACGHLHIIEYIFDNHSHNISSIDDKIYDVIAILATNNHILHVEKILKKYPINKNMLTYTAIRYNSLTLLEYMKKFDLLSYDLLSFDFLSKIICYQTVQFYINNFSSASDYISNIELIYDQKIKINDTETIDYLKN